MNKKIDDLIKEFEEKSKDCVSSNRKLWDKDKIADNLYNVDIHIWRKPGMGNSLQTIVGNKLSILTATTSFLKTLLYKGIFDMKDIKDIVEMLEE